MSKGFSPNLSTDALVAPAAVPAQTHWLRVALDVPLPGPFDYASPEPVEPGLRVIVPFGHRELIGLVLGSPTVPDLPVEQIKPIITVLRDLPAVSGHWLKLAQFAAQYYQRPLGEVVMPVLPAPLRKVAAYQGKRSGLGPVDRLQKRLAKKQAGKKASKHTAEQHTAAGSAVAPLADQSPAVSMMVAPGAVNSSDPDRALVPGAAHSTAPLQLNADQQQAVDAVLAVTAHRTILLHGVTGSGKTQVYLRVAEQKLRQGQQVLFLVPEINLTPQFERVLRDALAPVVSDDAIVVMHSGLTDTERLAAWVNSASGQARVMLGTRMAVFTPFADLGLVIVDEEHDTSYKQQEGLRYSARDLAIWRGHDLGIPVVLGSATPSLESWHHAQSGRYMHLTLPQRARAATPPKIELIDTRRQKLEHGFAPSLVQAIEATLCQQQQVLVFLNRRGYAPVLQCGSCGWVSQCARCSVHTVLHRATKGAAGGHRLHCHHCGYQASVPYACPECGDQDLKPMGRGTQRLEADLAERFPQARIARIDADSTRLKGSAERLFEQVHQGQVDILIGTQMVAKGHDFSNLGLVGVLNADSMLFSHDFRAPERLFAQLMQVAGRAGRHGQASRVLIQTDYPDQPVYQCLVQHDYPAFADYALQEREAIGLPPFAYQALLTAEATSLPLALAFLSEQRVQAVQWATTMVGADGISFYDPVPLRVVRVAHVERAQLLMESAHRPSLQAFLSYWSVHLAQAARYAKVRYTLEVDPLDI